MNQQTCVAEDNADFYHKLLEEGPATNIGELVHNPLCSGYFFKFCKSKYCSETTSFVIEVDKFVEIFSSDDGGWEEGLSWREIDKALSSTATPDGPTNIQQDIADRIHTAEFLPIESWPSGKVDRLLVIEKIRLIWSQFLADGASDQVCLPSGVLLNTCKRMLNVHMYGSEVFQEACENPGIISTLRDIATRFQISEDYALCLRRLLEFTKPAHNVSIHVPGPRHTLTAMYTKNRLLESEPAVLFSLDQFLSDNFLYVEFMSHLKRLSASANLRFIRAVHIYKKSFTNTDLSTHKKAADWAFKMYLNFLRPGSAYEVRVSEILRRDIARNLASPHIDLFQHVEKEISSILDGLFAAYMLTSEYTNLRLKLAEKFDDFDIQMKLKAAQGSMSYTTLNSKLSMARVLREGSSTGNSQVRPTPPGSGRRNINTFHHSMQNTFLQSGMNIGNTITASFGGLVNSVVPSHPRTSRQQQLDSARSANTAGSNRANNNTNSHSTIQVVRDVNATAASVEEPSTHSNNAALFAIPPHSTIISNLNVVTAPADASHGTSSKATTTEINNNNHNHNHNTNMDYTPATLAASSSISTTTTPLSMSSRLYQNRALHAGTPSFVQSPSYVHNEEQLPLITSALNSASGESTTRGPLPSPLLGREEETDGDNAKKIQKTNNGMFGGGGVYLPVLNFLGCMPTT
uniref:RGS domain-containing protein n=1 Tax=Spumella elongata TaxID=89044 RepID=A0A7S3HLQ8_9STRA